jgi:hypothetical protein
MKLKIHSWGGLGSQLHAISLIYDLKQNFPKREIILIHHTSGVSKRLFESEIFLDKSIELRIIDDYKWEKRSYAGKDMYLKKSFLHLAKYLLNFFSISIDVDKNKFRLIKPWTMELRGHYSNLEINKNFLKLCVELFTSNNLKNIDFQDALVIHYRLGDLLTLAEKSIISPDRILKEVKKVSNLYEFDKVVIYSDSTSVAEQKLSELNNIFDQIVYSDDPTIKVMESAITGKFFIGTNSKVSFWIENFRHSIQKSSFIIHRN